MTDDTQKMLANRALKLSEDIAAARLKQAGVTLDKDLGLKNPRQDANSGFTPTQLKRLAGG